MRDIILVVADTLTAFHLPFYGYDRDTAPFMSELAEENILFKQAYATSSWTVPVHASMFTGEMPDVCDTHTEDMYFDSRSIVEELSEEGYRTLGISNNYLVSDILGFDTGFDYFEAHDGIYLEAQGWDSLKEVFERELDGEYGSKKEKYLDFLKISARNLDYRSVLGGSKFFLKKILEEDHSFHDDAGADLTNRIIESKLPQVEEDFFLFVNYMEPHQPFRVPEGLEYSFVDRDEKDRYLEEVWDEDLNGEEVDQELVSISKDFYDTTIRYLDSKIEELYHDVEKNSDDFLFIVVGDHGEMLGDQKVWGHQCGIWEELLRVPVIISGPGIDSREIEGKFSLRRIYDLIKGDNPENLTSEKVFAEYRGVEGYNRRFGDREVPDGETEKKYYFNKSQAVVEGDELFVKNTELENLRYKIRDEGKGELLEAVEVPNSIKIRYGSEEDIEF
jgi:arylsulfatase A-like enzyme